MVSKVPLDFSNFELEITNRCNLACPRCARTDFIETFPKYWQTHDLSLDDFQKFIDPILKEIEIFEFKGTKGDPIFHPNFIDWIKWAKAINKKVHIHTNGQSGKVLWSKLKNILTQDDKIILGIDGLPNNFMKYRINANWKNIEACIEELKNVTTLIWQFIIFSYNQDDITQAKQLSEELGFSKFITMNSNRWLDNNDWLKPEQALSRPTENQAIEPQCLIIPSHIVSADGYYFPCCYLIDFRFRYKTPWAKTFDIRKVNIDDVLKSSIAIDFFATLTNESASKYCRFNCGKC